MKNGSHAFNPEKIKERRKKLYITQQELSELSGIPRTYLAQIENGKNDPKASTLTKIADALRVSVGYFFVKSVWYS